MKLWLSAISLLLASTASVVAQDEITCDENNKCPEDKPCCSQYGTCGTGSYCLGACDPKFSFNVSACVPLPICKSKHVEFPNLDNIVDQTKYLGDPGDYDFVTNNQILSYDNNVLLTMSNGSYGTVLTSTRAVWYGRVSATLKTSRTQGVVSAFILMSPVKDEIDYEFIGSFLEDGQTNYYWQGKLDYTHSQNVSLSNTFENYHTYTIDWTPDQITWEVDGQVGRVLKREDTYNDTTKAYEFPQTPSVVQISIWPGGSSENAQGTIDWAGGPIDWNADDIKDPGYFYVTLKDVSIDCYDPPSDAKKTGDKSYKITDIAALAENVEISGDDTVLGSFEAVGFDMNKGSDGNLENVSGSVPSGIIGGGNQHREGDDDSNVADASVVSIKPTSTKSESLADATGTAEKTTSTSSKSLPNASKVSDESETSTSGGDDAEETGDSDSSSSAEPTTTAVGGFVQGGDSSAEATTTAEQGNTAHSNKFDLFSGAFVGFAVVFAAMFTL